MKQRFIQAILLLVVGVVPFSNGLVKRGEAETAVSEEACVMTGLPSTSPMFATPKNFYIWLSSNPSDATGLSPGPATEVFSQAMKKMADCAPKSWPENGAKVTSRGVSGSTDPVYSPSGINLLDQVWLDNMYYDISYASQMYQQGVPMGGPQIYELNRTYLLCLNYNLLNTSTNLTQAQLAEMSDIAFFLSGWFAPGGNGGSCVLTQIRGSGSLDICGTSLEGSLASIFKPDRSGQNLAAAMAFLVNHPSNRLATLKAIQIDPARCPSSISPNTNPYTALSDLAKGLISDLEGAKGMKPFKVAPDMSTISEMVPVSARSQYIKHYNGIKEKWVAGSFFKSAVYGFESMGATYGLMGWRGVALQFMSHVRAKGIHNPKLGDFLEAANPKPTGYYSATVLFKQDIKGLSSPDTILSSMSEEDFAPLTEYSIFYVEPTSIEP